MVSFHPDDVVRYRSATGAPPRIGKVQELDPIWGVSVLWESGERSWFAYESWCPLQEETGWSLVLTTATFTPAADFAAAPEELGRGWLKKPPVRTAACQSAVWAVPELGSCASSGGAWLWPAWPSQEEAGPLGAQPLPKVLELAASKAADSTAVDPPGTIVHGKNSQARSSTGGATPAVTSAMGGLRSSISSSIRREPKRRRDDDVDAQIEFGLCVETEPATTEFGLCVETESNEIEPTANKTTTTTTAAFTATACAEIEPQEPPGEPTPRGAHWGKKCDRSGQDPIVGWRHTLLGGKDGKNGDTYDLCQAEFDNPSPSPGPSPGPSPSPNPNPNPSPNPNPNPNLCQAEFDKLPSHEKVDYTRLAPPPRTAVP